MPDTETDEVIIPTAILIIICIAVILIGYHLRTFDHCAGVANVTENSVCHYMI